MRKVFDIPHTRLHEAHGHCLVCQAGPFDTLEQILDHTDGHSPERLHSRAVMQDGNWILLLEPSDYYKAHPDEFPESLKCLRSIADQEQELGTAQGESHLLELTNLGKLRRQGN